MLRKRKHEHVLRSLNCVNCDDVVGSGTFGVVFKATEKETGDIVALKRIKMEKESNGFPITAIREIKILKALNHENIVRLKEIIIYDADADTNISPEYAARHSLTNGDIFMVFEFCDFDLSGLLRSPKVVLSDYHVKSYMKQLLYGVAYMHTNKILHRDIKGANILVTRGNVLKIADWGLARSYYSTEQQQFTNPVVTQWYRSPELLLGSTKYASEIDIWSIGCLFAEMRVRPHAPLLPGKDDLNQLELIYQLLGSPTGELESTFKALPDGDKMVIQKTYTPKLIRRFSNILDANTVQLLSRLMELDPKKRISAAAALDTEYFWNDPAPPPEQLPTFEVEAAFSMAEDERMREEHRKRQEEKKLQAAQPYSKQVDEGQSSSSGAMWRGGPGGRGPGGGRPPLMMGRGRGRAPLAPSKYAVLKPGEQPNRPTEGVAGAPTNVDLVSRQQQHNVLPSDATKPPPLVEGGAVTTEMPPPPVEACVVTTIMPPPPVEAVAVTTDVPPLPVDALGAVTTDVLPPLPL